MDLVERLAEDSFLRSHLVMELQAVFPSTTAAALTSLANGLWPSRHGAEPKTRILLTKPAASFKPLQEPGGARAMSCRAGDGLAQ